MVKSRFIAALALAAFAALSTPGAIAEGSTDVAVLLDVSQSVLPYFHDVTDFVVTSVVRDYVRKGDFFHLLAFGSETRVEIAQNMSNESDVKSVLGRLYLLYPLDTRTDFARSLEFLYSYLSGLPQDRPKVVVVITDGVHNPPPTSPTYVMSQAEVASAVEGSASRIRAKGWPVHFIKLPFPKAQDRGAEGGPASDADGRSYLDQAAAALGSVVSDFSGDDREGIAARALGVAKAVFPSHLGKKDFSFSFPLGIENSTDSKLTLQLEQAIVNGEDVLARRVSISVAPGATGVLNVPVLLPESVGEGERSLLVRLSFANGVRVSPREGIVSLTLERSALGALLRSNFRVLTLIVILALALAAVIAVILIVRGAGDRAKGPLTHAVLGADARSRDATTLRGAAERSASDRRERLAAADDAAAALAREKRESALRDAELLAGARRADSAAQTEASKKQGARRTTFGLVTREISAQERDRRERESAADESAAALVAARKEEAERSAALLASALPRRMPSQTEMARPRLSPSVFAYESRVVKDGEARIELRVVDQNPHIGLRNVHVIRAGSRKTVGGGASDFLIFLVRVPRHVADLHFDGEKLVFVPRRPEFFPELTGPVVDCLGVEIPMISSSGYPLVLTFGMYEEPAKSINKLLHCIDVPGLI